MTNYDSILQLSIPEMSKFLYSVYLSCCICCNKKGKCTPTDSCRERIEEWLTSPTETKNTNLEECSVEELGLNPKIFECLHQAGIVTIGELTNYTAYDLSKIPHLGEKSIAEIVSKLKETTEKDLKI